MDELDCAVIGGGVVGLAVARALALAGREVVVLEAEGAIGTGTSSRNSEVIHAGIYYPKGSLKARLCVEGKEALYAYAEERGVPHRRCGKLIVATSPEQVGELEIIRAKAAANGVDDLVLLTAQQAMAMEPQLHCEAALHSPSTGIVDSHALMLSLLGDVENAGGMLALKSPIARAECGTDAIVLAAEDGTALRCNTVVNAAGLGAPDLAKRFEGLPAAAIPTAYFAKGSYFTLSGRAPFSRLVYPVPEPGGLGVHLTIDLGGQAKFGPDVQWVESADDLVVDPARGDGFYAEVRKYWPALPDGGLIPGYAGMRPKISGPGEAARDFMIDGPKEHGVRGLVNLFGIESPGLTSSLAIGRYVASLLASS
ncbi:NAD(P)/FAD-dependent oxidoreductase [Variovorax sp. OV700]|jgi:L-2-hydroxyglutarate oxidase LhgO|uniref:NAD(P)/FAD-dependent oxidoreductase n=1 Tax=Variovorax sp. OV700 TaxID=1882826 RepID=UPI00087FA4C8|nr:NAD(P)/FAD-dependent oxidoreductase [Variovorax sp. OV700]SDH34574.1 L-2-hydroxyglutarate oxidase LhgO [Variovorax sp. OV700]